MKTFYNNLKKIEAHNQRHNETYKQSLMHDSDMTYEEIKSLRSGAKPPARYKRSPIVCLKKLDMEMIVPSSSMKY